MHINNPAHKPKIGDIWKYTYFPDLIYNKDRCEVIHVLLCEYKDGKYRAYCFEEGKYTEVSITSWGNTVGKTKWELVA